MRVVIVGYRGTGKTTVAPRLAEALGCEWADADSVLEARAQRTIREIFATEGEATFRDMEAIVLADLLQQPSIVIATGGGVILRPENRQRLKHEADVVVWLSAGVDTILERMASDPATAARRPRLTAAAPAEEVVRLLAEREPWYAEVATIAVDTVGREPAEIVAEIQSRLPTPGEERPLS